MEIVYNERIWAIDVISEINKWLYDKNVIIKKATGECTLNNGGSVLFPDALLCGENHLTDILQGWELKMPDTSITDKEFIDNAFSKAKLLRVNSFLVWNVSSACLYKIEGDNYFAIKNWNNLSFITDREFVEESRHLWVNMLHEILEYLTIYLPGNIYIENNIEKIDNAAIIELVLLSSNKTTSNLELAYMTDVDFFDEVNIWWEESKSMLNSTNNKPNFNHLATTIIISLINRLIFAHNAKIYNNDIFSVLRHLNGSQSVEEGLAMLKSISDSHGFANVFNSFIGEKYLSIDTWRDILSLNAFWLDLYGNSFDDTLLHDFLNKTISHAKRKLVGQVATPQSLSAFLVGMTMADKLGNFLDGTCGTGTIVKAVYDYKRFFNISPKDTMNTIYANDKFNYPIQLTSMALSCFENSNYPMKLLNKDIAEINVGDIFETINPKTNETLTLEIPKFKTIVSNLPFVEKEKSNKINDAIMLKANKIIANHIKDGSKLNKNSNLYAYIPFILWNLLDDNGHLGIVIYNSWLGTKWGDDFYKLLRKFFNINFIVTSSKDKWFSESDVVPNIFILEKKAVPMESNFKTSFISLNYDLNVLFGENGDIDYHRVNTLCSKIRTKLDGIHNGFEKRTYLEKDIDSLVLTGINKNSLFADVKWMSDIKSKLTRANTILDINRGIRRGWNDLFYPSKGHNIEPQYIKPLLRSSKSITGYTTESKDEAFCCIKSKSELLEENHMGAFTWINNFDGKTNSKNVPLTKVLAIKDGFWYSMELNSLSDIVTSTNPDKRLFFSKLKEPSFVDQRLITLSVKNKDSYDYDRVELCSALLNSVLGLFFIESLGFGRGLGALDLSATYLKENLHILNPDLLKRDEIDKIIDLYKNLEARNILNLEEELNLKDRVEFDKIILKIFQIENLYENIKDSLLSIYLRRQSMSKTKNKK